MQLVTPINFASKVVPQTANRLMPPGLAPMHSQIEFIPSLSANTIQFHAVPPKVLSSQLLTQLPISLLLPSLLDKPVSTRFNQHAEDLHSSQMILPESKSNTLNSRMPILTQLTSWEHIPSTPTTPTRELQYQLLECQEEITTSMLPLVETTLSMTTIPHHIIHLSTEPSSVSPEDTIKLLVEEKFITTQPKEIHKWPTWPLLPTLIAKTENCILQSLPPLILLPSELMSPQSHSTDPQPTTPPQEQASSQWQLLQYLDSSH